MSESRAFLDALFGYKPEDLYVLIWTGSNKRSRWFQSLETADAYVNDPQGRDVYVGVGLSTQDYGSDKRCPAQEVAGLVGFWADIDIASPEHKKQNLPQTREEADQLLADIGLAPTIIIHSGHGLQVWWLFNEPWIFDDDKERRDAIAMSAAWQRTIKQRAALHNWDVDSTHDLARVLRIPGTTNYKSEPVPVSMVEHHPDRVYSADDFTEYLLDPIAEPVIPEVGKLHLDPKASPPFDKWEILTTAEPRAAQSFARTRKDMQDQSGSSYDMSLASFAVQANWEDQEICDLLIAHRRRHNDDLKLRQDYYQSTISRARTHAVREQARESIVEATEQVYESDDARRSAILSKISQMFGVRVLRIVKYVTDEPQFRLETESGNIMLGDVSGLISQTKLRNSVAAATGVLLQKFKSAEWDAVAQGLLDVCEIENIGEDATAAGMADAWIGMYLERHQIVDSQDEAVNDESPYREGDHIHIFGSNFRRWLNLSQFEKVGARQMGLALRIYGAFPSTIHIKVNGTRTTREIWRLPKGHATAGNGV